MQFLAPLLYNIYLYCKWNSGETHTSTLIKRQKREQVFPSIASQGYFTVICYHVVLTVIIGFPFHL